MSEVDDERLHDLVAYFGKCRIAVLGDFFLDKYLDVDPALAETSLETGRPAHQVVSVRCSPGAAGTVVNNLAALGTGEILVLGFTGDDGEGYELRGALEALGCDARGLLTVPGRVTPTYLKPRDLRNPALSGEHDRYDTKNRRPTPAAAQEQLLAHLGRILPGVDAVIVLDQVDEADCGVVTEGVRAALAELGAGGPPKLYWADSRRRAGLFRNVIVKVNEAEALREGRGETENGKRKTENAEGEGKRDQGPGIGDGREKPKTENGKPGTDSGLTEDGLSAEGEGTLLRAIGELRRRTGKPVFVTAGARGIWVSDPVPTLVPALPVEGPIDPTGAGDSATAGAVLALCAGATLREAALVANLVASVTIQQLATTGTASPSELGPRLVQWRKTAGS